MADPGVLDFIDSFTLGDLPSATRARLHLAVLDLLSVAHAGRPAPASRIAAEVSDELMGGTGSTAWYDDRPLSPAGAALANGVLANVLDMDDGHSLTKGHPGAAVIPAAIAVGEAIGADATAILAAIAVGYEVAVRAAVAQHARSPEYHGTGSWGALGAAAAAARLLGLEPHETAHALGLAEYHGPIALIMRSVDLPAMTKDGIGWGAHVGVTSAYLARRGFTATPAGLLDEPQADWGRRWAIDELYLKPYPCCRWAQPAVRAATDLARQVDPVVVERVTIRTFAAAAALSQVAPSDTEQAQYNLRWPVACVLAQGSFGVADVLGGYHTPAKLDMLSRIVVEVDPAMTAVFPARRLTSVRLSLTDGTCLDSGPVEARGESGDPEWDELVLAKARTLLPMDHRWPVAAYATGLAESVLDPALHAGEAP